MRNLVNLMKQIKSDEDGASLVEYTVLLGVMLVAVIGFIGTVGGYVSTKWTALASGL